jgi:hypothetical protein
MRRRPWRVLSSAWHWEDASGVRFGFCLFGAVSRLLFWFLLVWRCFEIVVSCVENAQSAAAGGYANAI